MNQFIIKYVLATYAAPYLLRLFSHRVINNLYIQIKEAITPKEEPVIEYELINEDDYYNLFVYVRTDDWVNIEEEEEEEEEMESYSVYIQSNNTTPFSDDDDKTI